MFTSNDCPAVCATPVLQRVDSFPSIALVAAPPPLVDAVGTQLARESGIGAPTGGLALYTLSSAIDHQLPATPLSVCTIWIYCAVSSAKLTVMSCAEPVPDATCVQLVPSLETDTAYPRG